MLPERDQAKAKPLKICFLNFFLKSNKRIFYAPRQTHDACLGPFKCNMVSSLPLPKILTKSPRTQGVRAVLRDVDHDIKFSRIDGLLIGHFHDGAILPPVPLGYFFHSFI